jgi:hypothetical protein
VRTSEKYDELLAGFRALHVQVGRRLFDLRWHSVSLTPTQIEKAFRQAGKKPKRSGENTAFPGTLIFSSPDKDGGWGDLEWPCVTAEGRPFDPAKRQIVGHLCLPMDDEGDRFTLGRDVVTIPKGGIAAEPVSDGKETVGERFRELSAYAGTSLQHQWHELLSSFISVLDDAPANWWYALLFAAYNDAPVEFGRGDVAPDLDLRNPLFLSADLIGRLGLNTDRPKLPEDVWAIYKGGLTPPTANADERKGAGGAVVVTSPFDQPAANPPKTTTEEAPKRKKWDHLWNLMREMGAQTACGKDQQVANKHNQICAAKINEKKCRRLTADDVGKIRYDYTHPDRKQNQKKRS